jgi:AP-3 complex subunit sigma
MINAVLVFNNAGQPRLTKFYTQLVWLILRSALDSLFIII